MIDALMGMITGATEAIGSTMADFSSGLDSAYDSSFGQVEGAIDNAIPDAFKGGNYGQEKQGSSNMMNYAMPKSLSNNYVDANDQMRTVMSQSGILNPAASQLRSGSGMASTSVNGIVRREKENFEQFDPYAESLEQVDQQIEAIPTGVPAPILIEEEETENQSGGVLAAPIQPPTFAE